MIGEISIFGVFAPAPGLAALAAIVACGLVTRLLHIVGFYRLVLYRPVIDCAIFVFLFAAIVWIGGPSGSLS